MEREIRYVLAHRFSIEDPDFLRSMGQLLGPAIVPGNRATALENGDQIFPRCSGRSGAQRSLYHLRPTSIGREPIPGEEFSEALCERARAGVKVHVLLDWLGANKIDGKYLEAMKASGVAVEQYHPLLWYNFSRLNNRTHRKLLVVDGRIGFTGGVGIADVWAGDGSAKDHWRDSHYMIEGPAVAQMQAAFGDNWMKTRAEVLFGSAYYPELARSAHPGRRCSRARLRREARACA